MAYPAALVSTATTFGLLLSLVACGFNRPDLTRSATARRTDGFRVIAYRNGRYVIEHKGRRIVAKCRYSLTWVDDPKGAGKPMDEHDCTYMHGSLGQVVGDDLMVQRGDELVYYPWAGEDTVQTADFMDITDDEPMSWYEKIGL